MLLLKSARVVASAAIAGTLAGSAYAQDDPPAHVEPPNLSPLSLDASIGLTGEYTDNVFSTKSSKRDDFVFILTPEATLSLDTETIDAEIGAAAEIGRYMDYDSENYEDALISGEISAPLAEGFSMFAGADHAWEHEDRSSPDDVFGLEPTRYREGSAFGGIAFEGDPAFGRLGVNFRSLDYDDTPTLGGLVINNDDRDRVRAEYGGRIGYEVQEDRRVFAQGIYETRDYDSATDDFGFARSSTGYSAGVGVAGSYGPVSGEALIGALHRNYDDPALEDVTTLDLDAALTWRPDPRTRMRAVLDRTIEETTVPGASSYVSTGVGLFGQRWMTRDVSANAALYYSQNAYQGVDRTDHVAEAGIGVRWFFMPNLYVGGGYSYEQRNSDAAGEDYDTHKIRLSLGAELQPAYTETDHLATWDGDGFYAGVQGGVAALGVEVEGARGGGGGLAADFGDAGPVGGLFIGYRGFVEKLMLGLEVDVEASDLHFSHEGGRDFSVRRGESYGISALAGYRLDNLSLLYTRLGFIGTRFRTSYTLHDQRHDDSEIVAGMRFGAGVEFPISGALSGRMEYAVSSYPDYRHGSTPTAPVRDSFSNTEGVARIGLLYKFGGEQEQEAEVPPVRFEGPYVGAQIGHGLLTTQNSGPRPSSSVNSFTLDVERAGTGGAGGLYAGYGWTFDSIYLGAEIDAELSDANWAIDRAPDRRTYSVEKSGSIGASARAGYVLNESVLLYGRVGVVNAWFDTKYEHLGVTTKKSGSELGLRLGGGVEVGLTDSTRLRLDYSFTGYGSYDVDYGTGTDRFENAESTFRAGVSYAF